MTWSEVYLQCIMGLAKALGWVIGACLSALFLMVAWNAAFPAIFHLPTINFVQSFCVGFVVRALQRPGEMKIEKQEVSV